MGASLTTKSASSATNVNPAPLTQIPTKKQAPVWQQLSSLTFNVFRARNSHGSCVFKNKMWITGGRSEFYLQFDLHSNNKQADVWWSSDGSTWYQEVQLKGDFWAQNDDAVQPGPVAPWYARFGHSLTSLPPMAYKTPELMVLMGGYSPDPSNDIWVTEDGNNWIYCEHAAWSPRGWHGATLFKGMLWVTGGSPLNNEVWYLKSINQVPRRQPLTRSMYNNYTYVFDWAKASDGGYSPRAGIGFVSHWFFNQTNGETFLNSTEHLVVIGGFGGWLEGDQDPSHAYDGAYSRNDVWYSLDGMNWTLAIANAPFTGRAWFGCTTSRLGNPVLDVSESGRLQGGKLFVMGGGYVGSVAGTNQQVLSIDGAVDTWWTRDLVSWNKVNYDQGGNAVQGGAKPWQVQANYASKVIPLFSTELWAKTTVSSQTRWLGVWGMSVLSFNATSGDEVRYDKRPLVTLLFLISLH